MSARVTLYPAVATGRQLDVLVARGLIAARMPVGRCACSGYLYGADLAAPRRRGGGRWWLTVDCDRCGATVAWAGQVDAGEDDPAPVEDRSEPTRPVDPYRQLALPVSA